MHARLISVLVILVLVSPGCDGNPNDPSDIDGELAPLVGTWIATRLLFISQADLSQSVDLIQQGGSATLTISENGRFTFVTILPGEPTDTGMGSLHFEDGFLIAVDDEEPNDPLSFLALLKFMWVRNWLKGLQEAQ